MDALKQWFLYKLQLILNWWQPPPEEIEPWSDLMGNVRFYYNNDEDFKWSATVLIIVIAIVMAFAVSSPWLLAWRYRRRYNIDAFVAVAAIHALDESKHCLKLIAKHLERKRDYSTRSELLKAAA
ncbi:uncharacterized protein LOC134206901 [Armigeres subalbatus]|uniref:uncharacterized protein LOC134206901 n=1 Tax=Armigeres subalbatus TaxID=124917 RepID=UPI002ED39FD2